MTPRLAWVPDLYASLSRALEDQLGGYEVQDTVDPLKKNVVLRLNRNWVGSNFNPLQRIVHGFARSNGCEIYKIRKVPGQLIIETLIKNRLGPESRNNPFDGDKKAGGR